MDSAGDTPQWTDFAAFAQARAPELLRLAYVITQDQRKAEDLVTAALARTHRRWRPSPTISGYPERAIARLSDRTRAAAAFKALLGLSDEDTADLLGVPVPQVKQLVAKAALPAQRAKNLAKQAKPADLTERALEASRRLQLRRWLIAAAAVLLVVLVGVAVQLRRGDEQTPQASASPIDVKLAEVPDAPWPGAKPVVDPAGLKTSPLESGPWGSGETCANGVSTLDPYAGDAISLVADATGEVAGAGQVVAVALACDAADPTRYQVGLYQRQGEQLRRLGLVLPTDAVPAVFAVEIANGLIRVQVGDSAGRPQAAQHQWRAYRWQGSGATQVEGPTAFDASPQRAQLAVKSLGGAVFLPAGPHRWSARLSFEVRNVGPLEVPDLRLLFQLPPSALPAGGNWAGCGRYDGVNYHCPVGTLAPGESVTRDYELVLTGELTQLDSYRVLVEQAGETYVLESGESGAQDAYEMSVRK